MTSITASGKFETWPVQVWLDGDGVQLIPEVDAGKFRLEIAADATPGIRWARLFNAEGVTRPMALMVGTIAEAIEVEPNNDPGQAQTLGTKPVVVNGRLEQNADVDVFGVPLLAGQTLVADLEAHRYRGTPLDGILQILSPRDSSFQRMTTVVSSILGSLTRPVTMASYSSECSPFRLNLTKPSLLAPANATFIA